MALPGALARHAQPGHLALQNCEKRRQAPTAAAWNPARRQRCPGRGASSAQLRDSGSGWRLEASKQCAPPAGRQRRIGNALRVCAINIFNFDRQSAENNEEEKPAPCPASPCWADKFLRIPEEGLLIVPWGLKTVISVMLAWFASFFVVGHFCLPWLAAIVGMDRFSMTERGLALYSLCTDVIELVVGLGVIKLALRRFHPLPPGWFPLSLEGGIGWLRDVGIASLAFPLVSGLSRLSTEIAPFIAEGGGGWEQSVGGGDAIASMLYVMVVSVFAPVWEEVIFRGFLLPSLARYMSIDFAIVVSAVVFAVAHFSVERVLPLSLLGIVMGALYVRSRTLLAPMLLHSLWNGYAFLEVIFFR